MYGTGQTDFSAEGEQSPTAFRAARTPLSLRHQPDCCVHQLWERVHAPFSELIRALPRVTFQYSGEICKDAPRSSAACFQSYSPMPEDGYWLPAWSGDLARQTYYGGKAEHSLWRATASCGRSSARHRRRQSLTSCKRGREQSHKAAAGGVRQGFMKPHSTPMRGADEQRPCLPSLLRQPRCSIQARGRDGLLAGKRTQVLRDWLWARRFPSILGKSLPKTAVLLNLTKLTFPSTLVLSCRFL